MAQVLNQNSIKIGKKPVVVLPLEEWEQIMSYFEEIEEKERFIKAYEEGRTKKGITLNALKKKYNL